MRILRLIFVACISAVLLSGCDRPDQRSTDTSAIDRAFEERARDVQVESTGIVVRILSDDRAGSPHQRFIVRLPSGKTVLIQHNIELARRIDDLKEGDSIRFFGEYIWNTQGGLIHWTHHDPAGRHVGGWVEHKGRKYQ